ncbi:MFS transporter [Streptomyces sp. NBC_00249]|uniref:MFS transporter n=1 Tax=Streptomyces sp. NBC_00249 TaxID=2975690 RepID=UPI002257B6FB|nr:MFS transporter [Streptomyces sp. NBC_00249]MCX5197099.1 MFS transporter [Streptomyces sp. NBC_00249]
MNSSSSTPRLRFPVHAVSIRDLAQSKSLPGQVGLLTALSTVAFLLIGLPCGAWVDRMRRRPVMIAADLLRAALLLSVPAAWLLGVLTIGQLYGVVLLTGAATVFYDVSAQSHLPQLVGRHHLARANSLLATVDAAAQIGGRSVAGLLITLLPAAPTARDPGSVNASPPRRAVVANRASGQRN